MIKKTLISLSIMAVAGSVFAANTANTKTGLYTSAGIGYAKIQQNVSDGFKASPFAYNFNVGYLFDTGTAVKFGAEVGYTDFGSEKIDTSVKHDDFPKLEDAKAIEQFAAIEKGLHKLTHNVNTSGTFKESAISYLAVVDFAVPNTKFTVQGKAGIADVSEDYNTTASTTINPTGVKDLDNALQHLNKAFAKPVVVTKSLNAYRPEFALEGDYLIKKNFSATLTGLYIVGDKDNNANLPASAYTMLAGVKYAF